MAQSKRPRNDYQADPGEWLTDEDGVPYPPAVDGDTDLEGALHGWTDGNTAKEQIEGMGERPADEFNGKWVGQQLPRADATAFNVGIERGRPVIYLWTPVVAAVFKLKNATSNPLSVRVEEVRKIPHRGPPRDTAYDLPSRPLPDADTEDWTLIRVTFGYL